MNNKGFTLIELLAVVVLLTVVGGIASVGVISTINQSKLKSEGVFVQKLSNLIDDYLDLYRPTMSTGDEFEFSKCQNSDCSQKYTATAVKMLKSDGSAIYLKDLVDKGIVSEEQLVNPRSKLKCLLGDGPEIKVYKDNDYVYYYYVDLRGANTSCEISDENGIINTLPDDLSSEVGLS